jgi:hypothetical protein
VTVGGVGLSLVFTLVLMPALLRLQLRRAERAAPALAGRVLKPAA